MASKQILRRLPLLSRERLNQLNHGGFPDVANDVLPIVAGSDSNARSSPTGLAPAATDSPRGLLKPGLLPHTLGQWSQRLSHLQSLQKPLSTLGLPPGADATRPVWPTLADPGKQPSTTDIAAATLSPAIAGLLKHKLPVSTVAAIAYDPKLAGSKAAREASAVTQRPAITHASPSSAPAPVSPAATSTDDVMSPTLSVSTDETLAPVAAAATQLLAQPAPPQQQQQPQQPQQQQQQQRRGRGHSAASSSIQLNRHIMACQTTEQLLALVQHRGAHFDYFNISTALARVPKLAATGSPPTPQALYHHALAPPPPPPPPPPHVSAGAAAAAAAAALPSDLHVDASGRSLLDHLAQHMMTQINSFDARGLANSAWAFGKLKYVPSGGLPAVIAAVALRRMHEFSPQNLSNLVWSFVYMHHADEALLEAASRFVCARVGEFKPQELANIVWAFASLGHRDEQMMHVVAQQAQRIAPLFKEQELSNVLWAMGKMQLRDRPAALEALMAETRAKLPAFLPQGISNVAWALASVGHTDVRFLDQVVAQCGHQLRAFDVQALANMVWAMASLGYYQPHFVAGVVEECMGRGLERLSPQNLSNILWGCATLNHRDPRMLSAWAAHTLEKLPSFEPQGVSNTAWAFARLGFHSPQLFQALAAAALQKLDSFTAQGLSNLAWAMATAGSAQPRLFESLAAHATSLAPSFNAQNCSVTLWAFATLRHRDDQLFDVMLTRLAAGVDACEPQNISNALWAVARMGHPLPRECAAPLVAHAVRLLPLMSQQELCNSMWALACLDLMDEDLFGAFCGCLQRLRDISPEGVHQAYHAQLMFHSSLARAAGIPLSQLQQLAESEPPGSLALLPRLPEPIRTVGATMWAASARDVHVSRFHQEVSGALAVAGVPHALEWMTDDQHFSVDIGLQVNSQPTAVEVNGSHHYTSNVPHRALGDMAVRRRMLQDRGWRVVDVGFTDWEAMGRTAAERGSNLVGRIAASLDDWDWRFVGLPQRAAGAAAPPPQAVVPAVSQQAAAVPLAAAVSPSLQEAMTTAAMGFGALYPSALQAPSLTVPRFAPLADVGLAGAWPALGLGLGQLAGLGRGMDLGAGMDACGGMTVDEQSVEAAVDAAEALCALPGGNLLLAQQMYDVLGVRLPASGGLLTGVDGSGAGPTMADVMAQLSALQGGGVGATPSMGLGGVDEKELFSDDDLERVVQFALE